MTDDETVLTGHDVEAADLPDWRLLQHRLHARFETPDYGTGLQLVAAAGAAAERADHHPDLDLRYGHLDVRLRSHDVGGVTARDLRLAREISQLARDARTTPRPDVVKVVEIGLDVDDIAAVKPFWAAVLDLADTAPDELSDPAGVTSSVWFQDASDRAGEPTPPQRWHLDVRVPPEQVQARLQAALDAGGTLVSDESAPAFWVLADARGNKACLTTWQGRD